jgi:hypothetical protein
MSSSKEYRPIAKAIRYANGMVSCVDNYGNRIEEYTGRYDAMRRKIVDDAPAEAVFETFKWPDGFKAVAREDW